MGVHPIIVQLQNDANMAVGGRMYGRHDTSELSIFFSCSPEST